MKIVLSWLYEFLSGSPTAEEVAEALTSHGVEVSNIAQLGAGLEDVVIAKIVEFTKHPDADRLSICKVTDGHEVLDIVCGAKNFKQGDHVALAKIGAKLPNGMEIKKSKIRGQTSYGMLCSEEELKFKDSSEGILILPEESPLGQNLAAYLGKNDSVLTLELTPNRGDCLSVAGVAQELSAILKISAKIPSAGAKVMSHGNLKAQIKDPDGCQRYTLHRFDSVRVGPSAPKIASRLESCGIRPISNVVDLTNYVMLERGQPQHAFDADLVAGSIEIRKALPGERIVCLDDIERELQPEDLVIADEKGPIGIAGVMGGKRTAVSESTTSILLESAQFSPMYIRKTSKRLGLHTESSNRFERFVDPTGCWSASMRARELLEEHAGARALDELDIGKTSFSPLKIRLRKSTLVRYFGQDIKNAGDHLTHLGFTLEKIEDDYSVEIPLIRPDIIREVDLVEEVARLHGYNKFPSAIPAHSKVPALESSFSLKRKLKDLFASMGYLEARNYSFVSSEKNKTFQDFSNRLPIKILNGFTADMQEMRLSLIPGLVDIWTLNRSRQIKKVKVFECANVYAAPSTANDPHATPVDERHKIAMLVGGESNASWLAPVRTYDFYDLKGTVEELSSRLRLGFTYQKMEQVPSFLHPGQSTEILFRGRSIGFIGAVHPDMVKKIDHGEFFIAEFEADMILPSVNKQTGFKGISPYPVSKRDLAFIVGRDVTSIQFIEEIQKLSIPILTDIEVFDVYEGRGVPSAKKSLGYAFTFGSHERTLTDDEVNAAIDKVTKHMASSLDAQLRS